MQASLYSNILVLLSIAVEYCRRVQYGKTKERRGQYSDIGRLSPELLQKYEYENTSENWIGFFQLLYFPCMLALRAESKNSCYKVGIPRRFF